MPIKPVFLNLIFLLSISCDNDSVSSNNLNSLESELHQHRIDMMSKIDAVSQTLQAEYTVYLLQPKIQELRKEHRDFELQASRYEDRDGLNYELLRVSNRINEAYTKFANLSENTSSDLYNRSSNEIAALNDKIDKLMEESVLNARRIKELDWNKDLHLLKVMRREFSKTSSQRERDIINEEIDKLLSDQNISTLEKELLNLRDRQSEILVEQILLEMEIEKINNYREFQHKMLSMDKQQSISKEFIDIIDEVESLRAQLLQTE